MKEILQPIVDQVTQDWNKLYPTMTVNVKVYQFCVASGRIMIDGHIHIKGVGDTDGTFEIGNEQTSWDNPEEFFNGLNACLEECLLAHSQYQQNRSCSESH